MSFKERMLYGTVILLAGAGIGRSAERYLLRPARQLKRIKTLHQQYQSAYDADAQNAMSQNPQYTEQRMQSMDTIAQLFEAAKRETLNPNADNREFLTFQHAVIDFITSRIQPGMVVQNAGT